MRNVTTSLNITLIDFNSFAEGVENTFNTEIKKMFGIFTELSHKDRAKLYLYYTLKHILKLHKKYGNKNVIIYIHKTENINNLVLTKVIDIAHYFPIMLYYGDYDFSLIEIGKGETTEVAKEVTDLRLNFTFENFTNRKINNFYKTNGIKVFANVSDF